MLPTGSRLGPYEIVGSLGAGGMGAVYRARDTRLDRTVAIKVVRDWAGASPDFRQRLEREARAVSMLNHPGICTLHDVGQQDGIDFLVMELVDGETLATRLARGVLPLDQALSYAREMTEALDHAHRRGVIHRDLKPSNIMLTKGGVKLLDFGLAKVRHVTAGGEGLAPSMATQPMQRDPLTQQGMLLGTVHYMPPEQIEGKELDGRADLFAFGAVLYEMVTGRRAFDGPSPASVIAAILGTEPPPISTVRTLAPPALDRLVQGCLAKDPDDRWQDARDVRRALDAMSDESPLPAGSNLASARSRIWPRVAGAASIVLAAAGAAAVWAALISTGPADRTVTRLAVPLPPTEPYSTPLAISPDGETLAYGLGSPPNSWLYLRPLDEHNATRVDGAGGGNLPFFSSDGQWIGFVAQGRLKKVARAGGTPVALCDVPLFFGGTWGPDNTIVFTSGAASGLLRISAEGGTPQPLTTIGSGERSHRHAQFLPGGKAVLFTAFSTEMTSYDDARIEVVTLDTGERHVVVEGARRAWYASTGHLVYARAGKLLAVPFDVQRTRVTGAAVQVVSGVAMEGTAVHAAMAETGVLAYVPSDLPPDNNRTLVWIDREGQVTPIREERRPYLWPRISPDGRQIVSVLQAPNNMLWVHHVERNTFTRVTFKGDVSAAAWMPDSRRVVYASPGERGEELYATVVDGGGSEERLFASQNYLTAESVSPDGTKAIITERSPTTADDVSVISLGSEHKAQALLQTPASEHGARVSPDGRWLAYASNEAGLGRYEVYVRALAGRGGRYPISTHGARSVVWAASGRELFYRERDRIMTVDVRTAPAFSAGVPRPLFVLRGRYHEDFDVSPDGRFVMVQLSESAPPVQINVVLNWHEELKRQVAVR